MFEAFHVNLIITTERVIGSNSTLFASFVVQPACEQGEVNKASNIGQPSTIDYDTFVTQPIIDQTNTPPSEKQQTAGETI